MAKYRKLGKTSSQRKALLRNQTTALLHHGKIVTTEARAKEIRKVVEPLITMAIKERDNFETVTVTAKVPRKDANGKRVKEVVDGKRVTVFDEVQKEIKKDSLSRGGGSEGERWAEEKYQESGSGGQNVYRDRAEICGSQRRLHPYRQDRAA